MRIVKLRRSSVVVALSRRDAEVLLEMLVEGQAEWQDGVANGWIDPGEAPHWQDGRGDRMSRRLAEAIHAFGRTDGPAS